MSGHHNTFHHTIKVEPWHHAPKESLIVIHARVMRPDGREPIVMVELCECADLIGLEYVDRYIESLLELRNELAKDLGRLS